MMIKALTVAMLVAYSVEALSLKEQIQESLENEVAAVADASDADSLEVEGTSNCQNVSALRLIAPPLRNARTSYPLTRRALSSSNFSLVFSWASNESEMHSTLREAQLLHGDATTSERGE